MKRETTVGLLMPRPRASPAPKAATTCRRRFVAATVRPMATAVMLPRRVQGSITVVRANPSIPVDPIDSTEPINKICGTIQGLTCGNGEYCDMGRTGQCGAADGAGECVKKPEACTTQYAPVCGCDGKTYGNACFAAAAGMNIESDGECRYELLTPPSGLPTPPSGQSCGGIQGLACSPSQFCDYEPAAQCGAADQMGVCRDVPRNCPRDYRPVCGCDGRTYPNACTASGLGISVAAQAPCLTVGLERTCDSDKDCTADSFCSKFQCGDEFGKCEPRPELCTAQYDPVCGCDGKTYGNACIAAAAGRNVRFASACGAR